MEIGIYQSRHDALKAITIAYLSSIGFLTLQRKISALAMPIHGKSRTF